LRLAFTERASYFKIVKICVPAQQVVAPLPAATDNNTMTA
jgi:hypothetical protein